VPSFIGTWNTRRYRANDPANPDLIQIEITLDADPQSLDGAYPVPGANARMIGPMDATGVSWTATFDEGPGNLHTGVVMFVLSDDGNTIHGAWTSQQFGNEPKPWFGSRA
jgi:hypothetical protein